MSTLSLAVTDSATMLRRSLRHMQRYPSMTLLILGMPVVFLLLFVYVFGGTLGAGLGGVTHSRAVYVNYVTPGIILLTVAAAAQATAISVAMDMTEGIIARFRTMAIARSSVLTGHVLGSLIQSMLGVAVVIGIAVAIGFRPTANLAEWIAAAGVLAMISFALIWLSVALGLVSKSVETASNLPMFLLLLPFLGSGFVPTDSMPAGVRWFAEYQPFTPATETVRGLLLGTPIGNNAIIAVAWCAGIGDDYVDYVTPGILLFTIVGAAQSTSIQVATDMAEGIIARFRTMSIW
ncbi:MAG TPA: ABC transporter permease, partial [Gaiellales bacterium]|nr:ABC transporter permease [Gaiellales bacterium]